MGLRPTDSNEERPRDGELLAKFGSFFRGAVHSLLFTRQRDHSLRSRLISEQWLSSRERQIAGSTNFKLMTRRATCRPARRGARGSVS
jgi:hypothetical protein